MQDTRSLIEELGGGSKVADDLVAFLPPGEKAVDRESIYKAVEKNHVPHRWRPYLARLALSKGASLSPDLAAYAPVDQVQISQPTQAAE